MLLPCAEILGGHDAAAAADAAEQGKEQKRDRAGGSDRRQGVRAEQPPDDHGVCQVVGLLENIPDEQRQCKNRK